MGPHGKGWASACATLVVIIVVSPSVRAGDATRAHNYMYCLV